MQKHSNCIKMKKNSVYIKVSYTKSKMSCFAKRKFINIIKIKK